MAPSLLILWTIVAACACALAGIACAQHVLRRNSSAHKSAHKAEQLLDRARADAKPADKKVTVVSGSVHITRPKPHSVEGLEIQYGEQGLVRSVCVGAMNVEHKELLLIMDSVAWQTLPNAHKQEVLAAARSTWAAKMCADGPDVAYVIVKTERGEVVGRADPRCVTLV